MLRPLTHDELFNQRFFENSDTELSDVWGAVGQIGSTAVQMLPVLLNQGGNAAGPARGLAAINAFGQKAIQTLQQILQMLRGRQLSYSDAIQNANRIAGALSDPQFVYQAQHGSDADALNNFKRQAASIVQQIESEAAGSTASTQVATPIGSSISPATRFSIDPGILLFAGGGLALLLLLKR